LVFWSFASMYLLVVVFALSVVALLAAAWAIRRSVQRHGRKKESAGLGLSRSAATPEENDEL
jgi:membrane protein implicated in regulation of membrane protease activity